MRLCYGIAIATTISNYHRRLHHHHELPFTNVISKQPPRPHPVVVYRRFLHLSSNEVFLFGLQFLCLRLEC